MKSIFFTRKGEVIVKAQKVLTNPVWIVVIAVICNILWGSAFPFIKIGYDLFHISTSVSDKLLFAGIRFFSSGIILLVAYLLFYRRMPRLHKENVHNVVSLGIVQTTLQYIFFYIGVSNTTSTNGSIVNSMNVFLSAILAHFVYTNDKMDLRKSVGCLLGFGGVIFVTLGQGSVRFSMFGEGFIIVADLMFAIGSVISKKATKADDSWAVTAYNLILGGAILVGLGLISGGKLHTITMEGCLVLLYLALLSAVSFTLWAMLLKYNNIGKICIYNFVIPVAGTLLSGLMLKEDIFQFRYLVSLILVCGGIVIVNHSNAGNGKKQLQLWWNTAKKKL